MRSRARGFSLVIYGFDTQRPPHGPCPPSKPPVSRPIPTLTPPCGEDGPRGCPWIDLYQSPFIDVSCTTMENYYQNPLGRFFLEDTVKS
jgi:hypothetical protein